jgi:hypothetical protein
MTSFTSGPITRAFWERLWRMGGINFVIFSIIAYVIYGHQPQAGASADALVGFYDGDRKRISLDSSRPGRSRDSENLCTTGEISLTLQQNVESKVQKGLQRFALKIELSEILADEVSESPFHQPFFYARSGNLSSATSSERNDLRHNFPAARYL